MTFTLRLYTLSLDAARLVGPLANTIAHSDPDLGRQLRRALCSVHLNIAEGMNARGRTRPLRYDTALGSTNECIAALDVAEALGYVERDEATHDKLQHVRATLIRLVRRTS
ncbi:MAG: four helix bundle protein [Sandaracinaceae bacterium]|nr:four helix bundle protein [Sandaracinaceae bacterium]